MQQIVAQGFLCFFKFYFKFCVMMESQKGADFYVNGKDDKLKNERTENYVI